MAPLGRRSPWPKAMLTSMAPAPTPRRRPSAISRWRVPPSSAEAADLARRREAAPPADVAGSASSAAAGADGGATAAAHRSARSAAAGAWRRVAAIARERWLRGDHSAGAP
eukprot:CAMPEP_0176103964 /NCGR_PEP_ID=MMETSP0120_2-20121206/52162_1 /TAXON_ID=160619 /ORGANISM="Kryptoperidinium foliaceum, Strain CCMP 1326" /LENGTH=110 /DNA_ID=CAMNT_0017438057 /DNA_START=224 /DNA_END=554 /DNA_ORIENTATION=-